MLLTCCLSCFGPVFSLVRSDDNGPQRRRGRGRQDQSNHYPPRGRPVRRRRPATFLPGDCQQCRGPPERRRRVSGGDSHAVGELTDDSLLGIFFARRTDSRSLLHNMVREKNSRFEQVADLRNNNFTTHCRRFTADGHLPV